MQALLLVGGEGTRLRPLTCKTLKAMVPILNRPFLEHLFSYLARHGVDDIVLTLCYMPDRIESYFGRGGSHGVKLTYVMEESPLGTAGAVKNAERYLQERFFVFNGDIFTDLDLGAMMAFHRERGAKATIALTPVEDPSAYGVVETDSDRRVKRFVEKPKRGEATTNLINAGTYILEREVLQGVPPNTRFMFEHHLFPGLLQNDQLVYGYPSDAYWIDIGTPQKYCQVQYDLLQGRGQSSLCSPAKDGRPGFGARSSLHATASVEGAVVVGDDCSIGPHARIRGPVVMGSNCRVLDGAAIEGSVIWNNVTVGRNAWLEGCIVGSNSSIGEGCSVGRGVVIGEGVTVGDGIRLEPGRKVWPDNSV
jgi:mannose-1-phosphate guanylyltransferase